MGALKHLDPFPVLAIAGVVVGATTSASAAAQLIPEAVARFLVPALFAAVLVAGFRWAWEPLTEN